MWYLEVRVSGVGSRGVACGRVGVWVSPILTYKSKNDP